MLIVLCDKLMNELTGERCNLDEGHQGSCQGPHQNEEELLKEFINQISNRYFQDHQRAIKPYLDRLMEIESMKPIKMKISKKEYDKIFSSNLSLKT